MMAEMIHVLMVEDDPDDAALTREALRADKLAINLSVVGRAEDAERWLAEHGKPDLILLDLNLPGKSGKEFLWELRQKDRFRSVPVVVLTSSQADSDIAALYQCGANCYLTKPVDFQQFEKLVHQLSEFWFTVVRLPPRR